MEDNLVAPIVDGKITSIRFSLATEDEICTSSISDCPISHPSQLTNPFLGLPLESGKCESCGTAEPGKCDGHFGYIELPVPVYHPCHMNELKKLLNLVCLKCLRMKKKKMKLNSGNEKSLNAPCSYCQGIPQFCITEAETSDGAVFLELEAPKRFDLYEGFWHFLDKYGYQYGEGRTRPLLAYEVLEILKRFPEETRKKLAGKGHVPQDGYILQKLAVPPNCLSVPDISDGTSIMSSDISVSMLKKVLRQAENIKSSRSGPPNFESHQVEANDLQLAIAQYLHVRGTGKASHGINTKFGSTTEANNSSTKAWLEKMRTLFISKGSGFSSRTVITGDAYKKVNEVGLPLEIAQMVTFEEKVTEHNRDHLQKLVDNKQCLTYWDKGNKYSLREGSKGHTSLRVGQVVQRRVMDGDIVFINRQPSTHKHSLQALSVYVHNDHTVKINPLICAPLAADFDGDCIHLFYPQSLAAKAEVLELFSVEQQLLSSHSGTLNLQLANDALLSLKMMFDKFIFDKSTSQQLSMFVSTSLPHPFLLKTNSSGSQWTALQILQTALPAHFNCFGERYLVSESEILRADFNRDILQALLNEITSSVFFEKGVKETLDVLNSLQPLLMEHLYLDGYSVSLEDLFVPKSVTEDLQKNVQKVSPLLHQLRSSYNELVEMQIENYLRNEKLPLVNFIRGCSGVGNLIDLKSESSIDKVVQQIGFLGLQLADRGKFYSRTLVVDMTSFFLKKFAVNEVEYPCEAFGLIKSCFVEGLKPYEEFVHSISSREVLVRSSRGLTEPGTLFKNLMAILRDVVICYDGTVRNVCTDSVVQFEYGLDVGTSLLNFYPAGEPVGVLAATAVSNHAYKAVLDSSPSSNSSWGQMKETLLCTVQFKNELSDRRVILYLNECGCGKKYCKENAAYLVMNHLRKVSLKDVAVNFLIEYQKQQTSREIAVPNPCLVGHIHLDKKRLKDVGRTMHDVLLKCQETTSFFRRKKKSNLGELLKRMFLSVSECCDFENSCGLEGSLSPCLQFSTADASEFEKTSQFMADIICPVLLETVIKGDSRVATANIIWTMPGTTTWVTNHTRTEKGEVALEIVLQKDVVKQTGDAWRIVLDSCLSLLHTIDTRRSIPYAIKQVQELLGISCAFDQAVQRLSKSISKVAKGVLKEHLILVANSMACTGNLIGFNRVGYKTLFRALNVQVPFTEATLFMPRKCFERAAEKCHKDSLSGIVASCSWGKQVAVGTGTRFEILWNKKEMGSNEDGVIDVYNFLQLVRMSASEERLGTACLGVEIDDLELEDGDMELTFSPEHDSEYIKPIFDDDIEFHCNFEQPNTAEHDEPSEPNWESNSRTSKPSAWPGWGAEKEKEVSSDNLPEAGWNAATQKQISNSWGKEVDKSDKTGWAKNAQWGQQNGSHANHSTEASEKLPEAGWNTRATQKPPCNSWGKRVEESDRTGLAKNDENAQWGQQIGSYARDSTEASEELPEDGWNTRATQKQPSNSWGKQVEKLDRNGWAKGDDRAQLSQHIGSHASHATKPSEVLGETGWNSAAIQKRPSNSWEKQVEESERIGWAKNEEKSKWSQQFGSDRNQTAKPSEELSGAKWNAMESEKQSSNPWGKQLEESDTMDLGKNDGEAHWAQLKGSQGSQSMKLPLQLPGLQQPSDALAKKSEDPDTNGWNRNGDNASRGQWKSSSLEPSRSGWKALPSEDGSDPFAKNISKSNWGSSGAGGWSKTGSNAQDEQLRETPLKSSPWDTMMEEQDGKPESSRVWGSSNGGNQKEWGKRPGSRGWGSSNAGGKYNKGLSSMSPGRPDDWNASEIFTAKGQRLDQFTSEEQAILSDVEPIIHSIRRIIQQTRNDGDPLSDDDKSYILEKVFHYHPDRDTKIAHGVDYVTIRKHFKFPDTRCFYIVSADGHMEDFSYNKCMQNFIKQKYPEMAPAFTAKYFRSRPRPTRSSQDPRPGGSQEPNFRGSQEPHTEGNQEPRFGDGQESLPEGNQEVHFGNNQERPPEFNQEPPPEGNQEAHFGNNQERPPEFSQEPHFEDSQEPHPEGDQEPQFGGS